VQAHKSTAPYRCSARLDLEHIPKDFRAKSTWQAVADQLTTAARGADPADIAVALQLVLMLEKVTFRQK